MPQFIAAEYDLIALMRTCSVVLYPSPVSLHSVFNKFLANVFLALCEARCLGDSSLKYQRVDHFLLACFGFVWALPIPLRQYLSLL